LRSIADKRNFDSQHEAQRRKAGLVAIRETTEAKIFAGALHALARQGPKKMTMIDIATHSGVSEGTLHRYFKNKEAILAALGDHLVTKFEGVLQQAITEQPEPADRLRVVIDISLRFWQENPATLQLGQLEAVFAVDFIKGVVPQLSRVLRKALEPILSDSAAARNGLATVDEIVDLITRTAFSHYFMPADDYCDLRDLLVMLGQSAGLQPKKSRARASRKVASYDERLRVRSSPPPRDDRLAHRSQRDWVVCTPL
jgi:AcrR family transcriptional regulator